MNKITRYLTKITAIITISVAVLVLIGWVFNIPALTTMQSGVVPVRVNPAICFLLTGIALWLINKPNNSQFKKSIVVACSFAVFVTGLLTLSQYLFGWNLGIDELLMKESPGAVPLASSLPGRMRLFASINFSLLGVALLLLKNKKYHWLVQVAVFSTIPISLLAIFNHILGKSFLNSIPRFYNTTLPSSILFIMLVMGILYSLPLSYLKFSFQKKVAVFFALTILMLGIIFYAITQNNERSINSSQYVEHTNQVLLQCQLIRTEANEMQSGTRGFIITGNENYLPLFITSSGIIDKSISRLKTLTKDNPRQQLRIDTLEKLISNYIKDNNELISLRTNAGFEAAKKNVEQGAREKIMDNISTVISSIQQEENFLLVTRKQANQQNINNSSRVISLSQVIIVILLLAAFTVIYNNIRIRNKTEKEIKNLNEMLELKAEEKTREVIEKEKQYRFLLENMHEGIQVIGFDWRYLFVNSSVVQQSMYSNKELLGYTLMENYPGIENTELFRVLRRCMKERTSQIFENEFTSPNGTKGWFELSIQPVPEGLFILTMDITERKKAEQARKESELFISSVLASLKSQIAVIDESGAIITVNKAWDDFAKENGVTSLERTGKGSNYFDVCKKAAAEGDEIAAQCLKGILLVLKKEIKSFELEYPCHSPNKQRWFMLGVTNFEGDTPRVVIVHQDITARVLAEKKTEEQKTLSEGLLESAPDGIVGINEKGEIIIFNKQAENLFGYQRNEMIGEPLEKLMPVKFQETHKSNIQDYFKMPGTRQMGSRKKELFGVRKNGEQFPVDISLSVLLTANEKIAIAAIRDVTENKEITAKLLDKTIALEKSNIELERYAHVASHDLQEPLRMVSSFLQLLENKLEGSLDETNKKYIYFAVDGAERMRKLIQDLLQYSSVGTNKEEFTVTDLNDVMQYVTRVLNEKIKEGQALIMVKPLPVIMANKTLINEVFLNLVSNALKYRGEKNPEIEVGYTEEANSWKFYVKDNGIGIDPKYFEKIFVIFQRLHNKTEYSGTGIGLAICKKIVETHGGKIWVESELEKGSVFYFTIKK